LLENVELSVREDLLAIETIQRAYAENKQQRRKGGTSSHLGSTDAIASARSPDIESHSVRCSWLEASIPALDWEEMSAKDFAMRLIILYDNFPKMLVALERIVFSRHESKRATRWVMRVSRGGMQEEFPGESGETMSL
jgi:hypothetical protein